MIEYLRVSAAQPRDWHNDDYINRETWLAWPWPEPPRAPIRQRITRVLARIAGLVATLRRTRSPTAPNPAPDPHDPT